MKSLFVNLFVFSFLIVLTTSCSAGKNIETIKPEPDLKTPLVYESEVSFLKLPVTIDLKDIENQINKNLNGLIYNDSIINNDNLELKVWKQAPISVKSDEGINKIKIILPLKIKAKYRYGFEKMGVKLYDIKEFNLNAVVTLSSDISLTNWNLNTKTEIKSLDWIESPTVNIMGKEVVITYLINPAVRIFKSKIEKTIDESIKSSLNFKPYVLNTLEEISKPVQLSEEYESWLHILPSELYVTDAVLKNNKISMEMGLKCSIETIIGKEPVKEFNRNKIILRPVIKMPNKLNANIIAVSTYEDAAKIITKNFKEQEFTDGKRKVFVTNVDLWQKDDKMIIALDVKGSINGKVYLSGFPQYNGETKEIYFDKLEYTINTKNVLVNSANWLAKGVILRKIQENCRYSIQPNLDEGKRNTLKYLTNYSPMKGVVVNGKIQEFEFEKIQLTPTAILAFVKITGQVNLNIDGLE